MTRDEALHTLNLKDPFTVEDLRAAYRAGCRTAHPDAGGKATDFHDVKAAYDLLKSAEPAEPHPLQRFHRVCPTCEGEGYIILQSGRPGARGLRKRCPACNGDGLR